MHATTSDGRFPAHRDVVFTPEAIAAMSDALQSVCVALHIHKPEERNVIATRIIDLAQTGNVDAKALRDRILLEARAL
jgi:hypothetical protein